jgi:formylglycine-generating enzyme required for sulfatase activity
MPRSIIVLCLLAFHLSLWAQDTSFHNYTFSPNGNLFPFNMVAIPGGTFTMGSGAAGAPGDEAPATSVTVSPFWMASFEVTHDQYHIYYDDEKLSQGSGVDAVTRPTQQYIDLSWNMGKEGGFPMNSMSQDGALMYCRWLYQQTGIFYRLPTEAEWEYACRAGTKTAYFFGDDPGQLDEYAWYKDNSKNKYKKVGQKKPNPWGLYDMIGNVSEWTLDHYDSAYFSTIAGKANDPLIQPGTRYPRSLRGGSFLDDARAMRSSARSHSEPSWNRRDPQVPKSRWWLTDAMFAGFRIVRPAKQPTREEAEAFYQLYLAN